MFHKKSILFCIVFSFCLSLYAQFEFDAGVNLVASSRIFGVGIYLEPRYALSKNADLAFHLGYNGYLGEEKSHRKRIATGALPVISMGYIRRFPEGDNKAIPYVALSPGIYLTSGLNFRKGIKPGAGLKFGFFIGRSNIGFTHHFVKNDNFFQLNYGFRIFSIK